MCFFTRNPGFGKKPLVRKRAPQMKFHSPLKQYYDYENVPSGASLKFVSIAWAVECLFEDVHSFGGCAFPSGKAHPQNPSLKVANTVCLHPLLSYYDKKNCSTLFLPTRGDYSLLMVFSIVRIARKESVSTRPDPRPFFPPIPTRINTCF